LEGKEEYLMAKEMVTDLSVMNTKPPNNGKGRYVPFRDPDTGEEEWVAIVSDQEDTQPSDFKGL
jgi:hypothetical protein